MLKDAASVPAAADASMAPGGRQWTDPVALTAAAQSLKTSRKLRVRDVAAQLGVGEGELLAARLGETEAPRVIRLVDDFIAIVEDVPSLGDVMALTRNETVVHERRGVYGNLSHRGSMGLALGKDIDLRIFYSEWASAFAVVEPGPQGVLHSLQFFDKHAEAVHKIYLKSPEGVAAFDAFVLRWRADDQKPRGADPCLPLRAPAPVEQRDDEIDTEGLRAAWRAMTDTHEFFGMLKRFGTSRTQALRLADPEMVQRVPVASLQGLLEGAAESRVPIMVFVGNPGIIQIHTGPVENVRVMGSWLNVLDPLFNLHINVDLIADAFFVRKPTADGIVTSIEVFDAQQRNVAMFFGARKPGQPELLPWRALLDEVFPENEARQRGATSAIS